MRLLGSAIVASTLLLFAACADEGRPTTIVLPFDAGTSASSSNTLKANGEDCSQDSECAAGHCFAGGQASWCSPPGCTPANVKTLCVPVPPFDGTCNKQGYCRRPN